MAARRDIDTDGTGWYFFSGGPGSPRYGDDPTKHAVDHDSESFVREVLQNANDQALDDGSPVEVTFRFVSLTGEEKRSFLDALQWRDGLEHRLSAVARSDHGKGYDELLGRVDDPETPLRLLIVEDRQTTGLTGDWDEDSNYAALVRDELYSSKQEDTAGGSYGLGKSVLWTFSGASTVVFNSYLQTDTGVEGPRLIARSKLPTHDLPGDDVTYQGAGWLCRPTETDEGVRPEALGGRSAERLADQLRVNRPVVSGTSALVVDFCDPTRDRRPDLEAVAEEFVEAAVKYFWPAIYRNDLTVTVETPEATIEADVDSVPAIRPFVECYASRFADQGPLTDPGDIAGLDLPFELPPRGDGTETPDGSVRLAARLASPADDDTYLNTVALFRGAGMVVKYYDQSRVAYGDRNFHAVLASGEARPDHKPSAADEEIDRFLRFAEPPEHDEWESTENLREQYQRGFRTALEEMFGTMRDGLRHLLSKRGESEALTDSVLNRFPIHGDGVPRRESSVPGPFFEIDTSSRFADGRWQFSGRIAPIVDEFDGWTADIVLTSIGEDGSRYDEVTIDDLTVDTDTVTVNIEDGSAHLTAAGTADEVRFEGRSEVSPADDLLSGEVGETQLEVRAELRTEGGDTS